MQKQNSYYRTLAYVQRLQGKATDYSFDGWEPRLTYGKEMRCCLCRYLQKSVSCFTRSRDVCRRCLSVGKRMRWVNVSEGALRRWRVAIGLSQQDMGFLVGYSQVYMSSMENRAKISFATAARFANVFAVFGALGKDLRLILSEWPLFPMLVNQDVVEATLQALNLKPSTHEHLHTKRGADDPGPHVEGRGDVGP